MEKGKAKEKDYWHIIDEDPFERSWCPLFGEIPRTNLAESSLVNRCIDIIKKTRDLWSVPALLPKILETNWPKTEAIQDFPEWVIKAARSICWWDYSYIMQYANIYFLEQEQTVFRPESYPGERSQQFDIDQKVKTIIKFARDGIGFPNEHHKEIKDWHILSMLALAKAYRILKDILYYREPENDVAVLKEMIIATSLLSKAQRMGPEEYIEEMSLHTERGLKLSKSESKGGEARGESKKKDYDKIQELANKEWDVNPTWGKPQVAEVVRKKIVEDIRKKLQDDPTYEGKALSVERIRKIIKKPAKK